MEVILENKQTNKGHGNTWSYYNDLEGFCIYFYKRLRETDPKAYKVKTNKEVLEFYQSDPSRLEFITSQWNARRAITNDEQSRKGIIAGNLAKESGQYKEYCSAGGKKQGPIQGRSNVESGHLASITPKSGSKEAIKRNKERQKLMKERGTHNSQKLYECPTCGEPIKGSVTMKRFHGYDGEKCNLVKIYNKIPAGTYKMGELKELVKTIGLGPGGRLFKNPKYFIFIPIGTTGKKGLYKKVTK